jgi:hypothetical protein
MEHRSASAGSLLVHLQDSLQEDWRPTDFEIGKLEADAGHHHFFVQHPNGGKCRGRVSGVGSGACCVRCHADCARSGVAVTGVIVGRLRRNRP